MSTNSSDKKDIILKFGPQRALSEEQNGTSNKCVVVENYQDKVPNYLNLACCVNGYSNLTTYDSKIRQDINKSREVSPIRPSSSALQYCKQSNLLTPPTLLSLDNVDKPQMPDKISNNQPEQSREPSLIQQRVELLYGKTQGFYTPNKGRKLAVTPGADAQTNGRHLPHDETDKAELDLPVFRHLSKQFRSQLPKLSPKRSSIKDSSMETDNRVKSSDALHLSTKEPLSSEQRLREVHSASPVLSQSPAGNGHSNSSLSQKDGHYFIKVLRSEQTRLLALADVAENYISELTTNAEISEDILGLLRSASGKARLLVSQKMKQFEGLCQSNLNPKPTEKFPTTNDDLQGFWDMVKLQVDHVDSIFAEIEALKACKWQKSALKVEEKQSNSSIKQQKTPGKSLNKATPGPDSKTNTPMSAAAQKREQQRKLLLEMKRKNKLAMAASKALNVDADSLKESPNSVEIYANNNTNNT